MGGGAVAGGGFDSAPCSFTNPFEDHVVEGLGEGVWPYSM